MKALLMQPDRDFDLQQPLPANEGDLRRDLELETLFRAMAGQDEFLLDVARKAVLNGTKNDLPTVLHRQAVMKDCLANPAAVRQLYDLAVQAIEGRRQHYFGFGLGHYPGGVLHGSLGALRFFMGVLKEIRGVARANSGRFASPGFTTLFATLESELSDAYFERVHAELAELEFRHGVLESAALGSGNEGVDYVLRKPADNGPGWIKRLLGMGPPAFTFTIHPRDEAGARALSELRDRGINLVANALGQSADHVQSFFVMLRTELAFYLGAAALHEKLAAAGEPTCFPVPRSHAQRRLHAAGLYDPCLALSMGAKVVGNACNADGRNLVIITGANRGGKSTFLRALGLAQLMLQAGMFVAAESFDAGLCAGLYTHFKREEDAGMESGKFDEELVRMSAIAGQVGPDSLVLFNESFGATNEREGSEIARQVVRALLEKRIRVFFVTHQYDFAHGFYVRKADEVLSLRAERAEDGSRPFRLVEGEPLDTSYGADLYREIFGDHAAGALPVKAAKTQRRAIG